MQGVDGRSIIIQGGNEFAHSTYALDFPAIPQVIQETICKKKGRQAQSQGPDNPDNYLSQI